MVLDILYREEQIYKISKRLNINKVDVNLIIKNYSSYLQEKLNVGETIKILNICYIKNVQEESDFKLETLGYIATEIADNTNMGRETVLRVLSTLEECIIQDIKNGKGYSLRGLVRIRCTDGKVRIKKSTKYNGKPVYVVTLNSFRRKVELDAG